MAKKEKKDRTHVQYRVRKLRCPNDQGGVVCNTILLGDDHVGYSCPSCGYSCA